jgi:regulation of enolase protein 1 (concanavalin A-like superfamily)
MNTLTTLKDAEWLNPPPEWHLGDDALVFETGHETDFWRATLYGFNRDDGHAFLVPVRGDFTAHLTFDGAYNTLYDQAGLMLRQNETHWIKAGIEFSDDVSNMSVVVTRDASDWSILALPVATGPQRLRLTRIGTAVIVQFRNAANRWQLLRVADFSVGPELLIGPMACSPKRAGFQAVFTEFTIGPAVAEALHDESPAT